MLDVEVLEQYTGEMVTEAARIAEDNWQRARNAIKWCSQSGCTCSCIHCDPHHDSRARMMGHTPECVERARPQPCNNCGRTHLTRYPGWPDCDPWQTHHFMTSTGMEGRCEICGGPPEAMTH